MELWTGFTLGLLGSFHCIGMCGPIALSIPGDDQHFSSVITKGMVYNLGRVFTYSFLGYFLGVLGMGASIAGYQHLLSIVLGVLIIVFSIFPKFANSHYFQKTYSKISSRLSSLIGGLYREHTLSSRFFIGALNGLLPCGFVVVGLAAALITTSAVHSMAYMGLFGLGTIPVMLLLNVAPTFISPGIRAKLRPLSSWFAVFVGVLLIIRGFLSGEMAGSHQMGMILGF